jgi:hypothetical protein
MSKDEDKIKHSKRLHKDEAAIAKQVKIAKTHGIPVDNPHKFAKHHAMDCGNPTVPCAPIPDTTSQPKTI